jgi:hypothetical protein
MGQEFQIKSAGLEAKIRQLLPSQGGFGAGVDLSGSTQIIPIVDLTESAEGSNLRQDLQTAFTLTNVNQFNISSTTATIISSTGFWRIIGTSTIVSAGANVSNIINLTDGVTSKQLYRMQSKVGGTVGEYLFLNYDFVFKLSAGESINITAGANSNMSGAIRQIATVDGELVDPT